VRSRSGRLESRLGSPWSRAQPVSRERRPPRIELVGDSEDAFYGYRRYEADDLERHHWHFAESLQAIGAREQASR
jgi:hypothetical protein